ncbi:MAG: M48 family metalloprotease [Gammaproteobacteria bacterium]
MKVLPRNAISYILLIVFATAFLVAPFASAAPFKYHWDIRELARADAAIIELRTTDNRLIEKISTTQMRILHAVKTSIVKVAETDTKLIIVDGAQPNAFAGKEKNAGNIIGINFAMLEIIGLDVHAAAALIGHEIAHLKLKHGEKKSRSELRSAVLEAAGGVALSSLGVPLGQTISSIGITAIETEYSRDAEREADYLGAIWAVEAGYEAVGAVRLHEAIQKSARSTGAPFLSTHPSGPERIKTLRGLANRLAP